VEEGAKVWLMVRMGAAWMLMCEGLSGVEEGRVGVWSVRVRLTVYNCLYFSWAE
jgi:hypothetical protein